MRWVTLDPRLPALPAPSADILEPLLELIRPLILVLSSWLWGGALSDDDAALLPSAAPQHELHVVGWTRLAIAVLVAVSTLASLTAAFSFVKRWVRDRRGGADTPTTAARRKKNPKSGKKSGRGKKTWAGNEDNDGHDEDGGAFQDDPPVRSIRSARTRAGSGTSSPVFNNRSLRSASTPMPSHATLQSMNARIAELEAERTAFLDDSTSYRKMFLRVISAKQKEREDQVDQADLAEDLAADLAAADMAAAATQGGGGKGKGKGKRTDSVAGGGSDGNGQRGRMSLSSDGSRRRRGPLCCFRRCYVKLCPYWLCLLLRIPFVLFLLFAVMLSTANVWDPQGEVIGKLLRSGDFHLQTKLGVDPSSLNLTRLFRVRGRELRVGEQMLAEDPSLRAPPGDLRAGDHFHWARGVEGRGLRAADPLPPPAVGNRSNVPGDGH